MYGWQFWSNLVRTTSSDLGLLFESDGEGFEVDDEEEESDDSSLASDLRLKQSLSPLSPPPPPLG